MFCPSCDQDIIPEDAKYCHRCGKGIFQPTDMSKGLFGRVDVKSFIEGGQKKDEDNDDGEVVISIGLMVWDVNEEVLKEKRGNEGKEYTILLQDGQEAVFLPGSRKEFFSLKRYKEELLKDYKRLTFFLCSTEDLEARNGDTKEQWNDDRSEDEDLPHKRKKREECDYARAEPSDIPPMGKAGPSGTQAVGVAGPSGIQPDLVTSDSEEIQINSDEQVAWSLQEELNKEMNAAADYSTIDDEAGVLNALEEKVIRDKKSLFLVVRRGTPLERVLNLWHRETLKISPDHELRIKFLGEDGIDSGALSKEFLTKTVVDIATKILSQWKPEHAGEIVATSLAQGGPPPCFLAETVYDTLVLESDIDFSSVSPETASDFD
ncbi:Protein phosphatase 2C 6 [Desmophyllum pertusum]|uniref:Protein phosphatase 2C 6 n=1 Tax=Desmophyllum pertusum TaxID=174260 RepID=A0A9X0D2U2_9CNID|nr:Protein phosphatase 2C 6 [Desmophyllum pertusum]